MDKRKNVELPMGKIKNSISKALFFNTNIQLIDNKKVIVENCKHILECNEILVRILTGEFDIYIWGTDLSLSNFNSEFVVVNGIITSLEINPKGRGV